MPKILLVVAVGAVANIFGSKNAGWAIMAAGLIGPTAALIWHMVPRERPDSFIIVPLGGPGAVHAPVRPQ
ncbi:hypothetical protein [Streptomyces marianii]|uniref:Uncharacterized protein n=1 Tax=Streptomyces marianii TaxID=1817406 RepID=A0A5R9ECX8_9ACTN|nr:hypothetical protein [Streptomyces marianii]TLQ47838.1 hypothetical protein FEF34_37375 [Streptomyces marianii]